MIYIISNPTLATYNYVCSDQASIEIGKLFNSNGIFTIGGQEEAFAIADQNRAEWLANNVDLFSVNKDTNPDPVDTTWEPCDLDAEPQNNDVDYNIFNVINGYYTLVTGLDAAKALLATTKVNAANFIVQINELEQWPPLPKAFYRGVQDL